MSKVLPDEVIQAWKDREGPLVLTTVDSSGMPNTIYAGIAGLISDGRPAVCDNYFDKTFRNVKSGCKGNVLFLNKARKAYQIKGALEYHTSGALFDEMLAWADPKHPRKGVAVLNASEVYSGSTLLA